MSELQIIQETLARAATRRRWARALRGLWSGLLVGAVLWLLALVIFKLTPVAPAFLLGSGLAALLCPVAGFVAGGWRKPALGDTARWVDVKQNLKERMSTALEFAGDEKSGTWRDLVLNDAVNHAQEINPRQLVPFHLTRAARWAVLLLALAAGLGFVPEYRSQAYRQKQTDAKVIQQVGKQVAELARREIQQRPPHADTTKKSLESVAELGDELNHKVLTRSEALKDVASVSDKLKQQLNEIAKDPGLKKLEQAARASSGANNQTASGQPKAMDALQKQGANANQPEALDKLQNDLEKLQEAAKALANKTGADAEAERQKLSASLASLSQQAAEAGVQLPQLDEALEALAQNETDRFLKDLDTAMVDLEKLRDTAKKLAQMQAQAEKLGKDLAEQLQNGQAEAAAGTLKKLAEQLKSANLTAEQQQKIMAEVSQAVPQAAEYGKVEELLKQAVGQMQQGNKPNAAESLSQAAAELDKLMQQMNDAQSLMASLESLDQASQAISSGKTWTQLSSGKPCSQCNGKGCSLCAGNKRGYNPFGKNPGTGVGTWGEEGGEWVESGAWTPHGDNSALNDRDQAGRGITDRDPRDLGEVLKPDKVKGQFSPGGQMPSITLKGVSIKGSSKVQYEEAAATAQSDAQAALSQEKVPRAYQGAVKDYFDDLKK